MGGTLAASLALAPFAGKLLNEGENAKLEKFGIQLWTVKNALGKDPQGVLKQLSEDGYKQIESFEGGKGMFWGMTPTDFKKYMDDLDMKIISSHCNIRKILKRKLVTLLLLG